MKHYLLYTLCLLAVSCTSTKSIDLLITNGTVYTVDSSFATANAIAINHGKIVETGNKDDLSKKYQPKNTLDAKGQFIYPGFIDAHLHFIEYGAALQNANLVGTTSWEEAVARVKNFAQTAKTKWITGYGWDQNDWKNKNFPKNQLLNEAFPDRPVFLSRVDGHAAIANQKALELAGVKPGDQIAGGVVETENGKLTGLLIDNAVSLVSEKIPPMSTDIITKSLEEAQANCFAAGLTEVHDCGISYQQALMLDSLQKTGLLKMKIYGLLSDRKENYNWLFEHGKLETERLTVRGFKVYADGALGSRGACLLQPYSDKPGWYGFLLSPQSHFDSVANIIYDHGFQMCTHAIGDSGNRVILTTYAKYLKGKNDLRWRIEHAQIINKDDFHYFGDYSIIPSVQPTHATSDMYWAGDRLGTERLQYAYAYRLLMQQNGWEAFGTDAPVEDISPLKTFYAAVFRQDASGYPSGGFEMQNAVSREDAIRGMTIWAAKAAFQEGTKGSLEKGKYADIVILDKDLLKAPKEEILKAKVTATLINGEIVHSAK